MPDYFNLINELCVGTPPAPGRVSYTVRWGEATEHVTIQNAAADFAGRFSRGPAMVKWSGRAGDFEYVSDDASTSVSLVAESVASETASYFRSR